MVATWIELLGTYRLDYAYEHLRIVRKVRFSDCDTVTAKKQFYCLRQLLSCTFEVFLPLFGPVSACSDVKLQARQARGSKKDFGTKNTKHREILDQTFSLTLLNIQFANYDIGSSVLPKESMRLSYTP